MPSLGQFVALSPLQLLQPLWKLSAKALHIVFSIDFPAHLLNASFELLSGLLPRASWSLARHPVTHQIAITISFLLLYFLFQKKKKGNTQETAVSWRSTSPIVPHCAVASSPMNGFRPALLRPSFHPCVTLLLLW